MSKNILIVTTEFPPMPGGIGNHAYHLARQLSRLKYPVTVLTEHRESQPGEWEKMVAANKDLNIIGVRRRRVIVSTYFQRYWRLFRLVRRTAFQTVIYSGKFAVWLNGLMPATQSIVVIHGSEIKQSGVLRFLFERSLKRAAYIVCVSNFTKNQLVSHYMKLDGEKIVVINNGFDDLPSNREKSAPLERKTAINHLNLVTVGGIHRRKGQFNVVGALPEIIKVFPDVKYHIVGLPAEKEQLLELIEKENVRRHVVFHHGLTDVQLKEILTESDIFVMLSEHLENGDFEGFGIAVIEAMALGLPAIGTRRSGIADAVKDGFSGKLVDPKNTAEILSALQEISEHYEQYSANAKNWAAGFRWRNKITEYESLINKL